MNLLESVSIQCPYCWEMIDIQVDCSITDQSYVEDCQVCCKPICLTVSITSCGMPAVEAFQENGQKHLFCIIF